MLSKFTRGAITAAATLAVVLGFAALPAGASASPAVKEYSASTRILNHPDSGTGGNWAYDDFTRTVTIARHGEAPVADCPGTDTGHCYSWTYSITDSGKARTIPGAESPRGFAALDLKLAVTMLGGTANGQFFSSWKTADPQLVPATEDDGYASPTGRHTTTDWPELFFGASAVFNSAASPGGPDPGSSAGWTYTGTFGFDPQCVHAGWQWVDAAASGWGGMKGDGDIQAPSAADCP